MSYTDVEHERALGRLVADMAKPERMEIQMSTDTNTVAPEPRDGESTADYASRLAAWAFNNYALVAAAPGLLSLCQEMQAAFKVVKGFIDDIGDSNPGWLGKLCLQDYAQMNDAFIAIDHFGGSERAIIAKADLSA